ncbi:YjcZ family sporulation protein [Bacillus sp. FJAT-47783]|nr:YjcZ family sporulation protein [Bacillus sp. FJAT-47783]
MGESYQGGSGFAIVLVLFILLAIIGAAALRGYGY